MHLKWSFLIILCFPSLYADKSVPTTLDTIKSYVRPIGQFAHDNKKTIKNSAKAIAAAWLLKGLYNVMWDQVNILDRTQKKSAYDVAHVICFPKYQKEDPLFDHPEAISCPPYLTAFAISAYLLESNIYEKLGTWIKEHFALNDHALKIVKNCAKIGGALLLLKGHYNLAHDQVTTINSHFKGSGTREIRKTKGEYEKEPKSYLAISKQILLPSIPARGYNSERILISYQQRISSPPYIPALGISAYLLATGSHGIYKEIRELVQQYKKPRNIS